MFVCAVSCYKILCSVPVVYYSSLKETSHNHHTFILEGLTELNVEGFLKTGCQGMGAQGCLIIGCWGPWLRVFDNKVLKNMLRVVW